jgi:hypothetical protein
MNRLLLVLALPLLATTLIAQTPPKNASTTPPSPELLKKLVDLRDAALASDYSWEQLAYLTENVGPRPAGSAAAQGASEHVAAELRKLGLDVHMEKARVSHFVRGEEKAELVEYPGQLSQASQRIVLTTLSGSSSTSPQGLTSDVVVVHNFDELAALGREKVSGKIVLFNVVYDERKAVAGFAFDAYGEAVAYRVRGPRAAADVGATACLIRSVGGANYRLPHTGYSEPTGIPAAALTAEDADLVEHLARQGRVRMHLILTPQHQPDTTGFNVVADIKGSEHPEQVVIVSGHLDSWDLGRGAIDDGAGVAIAMETAQLIQKLGLKPRRTLRVIAWMDEENGGGGHDAYAKTHAAALAQHIAAIESDSGAGHPLGFALKMSPQAVASLAPVLNVLRPVGATVVRAIDRSPGSDIEPLVEAGVPGIGLLQDSRTYFDYHHTAADTLDKVNAQDLRENAAAMAVMGFMLADMPDSLPR